MREHIVWLTKVVLIGYFVVIEARAGSTEVGLRYKWEPLKRYYYKQAIVQGVSDGHQEIVGELLFVPIQVAASNVVLAVQIAGRTNHAYFANVDLQGRLISAAISTSGEFAVGGSMPNSVFRNAISAMNRYMPAVWELPVQVSAHNTDCLGPDGSEWQCEIDGPRCTIKGPKDEDGSRVLTRVFDVKLGLLLDCSFGDSLPRERVFLDAVEAVSAREQGDLQQEFATAMPLDTFRERLILSAGTNASQYIQRRMAFSVLPKIADDETKERIWREVLRGSSYEDGCRPTPYASSYVQEISRTRRAAISFLLDEELVKVGCKDLQKKCLAVLSERSGLDLGGKAQAWREWFRRVDRHLPDFGETQTKKLVESVTVSDPWVRLFALKQLALREGVSNLPGEQWRRLSDHWEVVALSGVFEEASKDEDETVRSFASNTLSLIRNADRQEQGENKNGGSEDRPIR